jgi:Uma2 family endonuclease
MSFQSAPDWTIEILSPDQKYIKVTKNILHCLTHGTQLGWLIDPDEQMVLTYAPDGNLIFLMTQPMYYPSQRLQPIYI